MPNPFCPSLGWVIAQESLNAVEALFGFAAICVMVIFPILGGIGSLIQKLFEKNSKQPPPYRTSPFSNPPLSAPNALAKKPETGFTTTSPSPSVPHRDEDPKILVARSLAAADTKPSPPGRCKKCGGSWARRVNHQTGGRFWGCSNYPRCTNTYDAQAKKPRPKPVQKKPAKQASQSPKSQVRSVPPKSQAQGPRTQWRSKSDERTYTNYSSKGRDLSIHHTPEQRRRAERFWRQDHPMGLREECQFGHPFSEENTYYRDRSELGVISRECRICRRASR